MSLRILLPPRSECESWHMLLSHEARTCLALETGWYYLPSYLICSLSEFCENAVALLEKSSSCWKDLKMKIEYQKYSEVFILTSMHAKSYIMSQ